MSAIRALVTGASGSVGRALVAELRRRGAVVTAVALEAEGDVHAVDLEDRAALAALLGAARPTHVFHLAGVFRADGYEPLLRVNCGLAAALLDATASLAHRDARIVMVGSAAEYGPVEASEGPVTEARACRPVAPYGVSKLAQTELALAAARGGRAVLVVRPSNVIGPGISTLLSIGNFARQARAIRDGGAAPVVRVGDLDPIRDFVDARDLASAMIDLAGDDTAMGRVFNVSRGSGHTLREALEELLRAFGIAPRIETDPSLASTRGGASYFVADHALLARHVAFQPRSLRESMTWLASER